MAEAACTFGRSAALTGVVGLPDDGDAATAVVFLNAGLVHRVGPHRLYVNLARDLTARGYLTLRFDLSGVGDSGARRDGLPFEESAVAETREAMDWLQQRHGCRRFVLAGICSGAMIASRTADQDERVAGVALVNTQSHQEMSPDLSRYLESKRASTYFWKVSLFNPRSWKAALTGRLDYRANVAMLWRQLKGALRRGPRFAIEDHDFTRELVRIRARGVRALMVYSEGDPSHDLFEAVIRPGLGAGENGLDLEIIRGTDHTFTPIWSQERLAGTIVDWLAAAAPPDEEQEEGRI